MKCKCKDTRRTAPTARTAQLPDNIKDVLGLLIDEKVKLVLDSGREECVEVLGIEDNLLVARLDDYIKFTDIDCICQVIANPDDVLDSLFNDKCRCNN